MRDLRSVDPTAAQQQCLYCSQVINRYRLPSMVDVPTTKLLPLLRLLTRTMIIITLL